MKYNLNSQFINLRLPQVNFLAGYQFIRTELKIWYSFVSSLTLCKHSEFEISCFKKKNWNKS